MGFYREFPSGEMKISDFPMASSQYKKITFWWCNIDEFA